MIGSSIFFIFGKKRKRFSLMELLVVVTLIATLVSLLLPVLLATRNKAKRTVCISRQRQYLLALSLYANDYKTYPQHRFFGRETGEVSSQSLYGGYSSLKGPWTGSTGSDVNCGKSFAMPLVEQSYIDKAASLTCNGIDETLDLVTGDFMHRTRKTDESLPFFAYLGPGASYKVKQDWCNPLPSYDKFVVDNVHSTYGFRNGYEKVYGTFKLISCPSFGLNDETNWLFAPHDNDKVLNPNRILDDGAQVMHYRNYGWSDGHVEGYSSVNGFLQ